MTRRSPPVRQTSGFTLTELLVVLTIMGVLLAIAVPSFRTVIENQRIRAASSDLYASLAFARSEAIKRNVNVTLAPIAGDWTNGWRVPHPTLANTFLEEHAAVEKFSVSGPTSGVVFTSSGRVSAGADVTFTLSGIHAANRRCVYLSLSGRPSVKSC